MLLNLIIVSYFAYLSCVSATYQVCVNQSVSLDVWESLKSTDRRVWASATFLSRSWLLLAEIAANESLVSLEHDIPLLQLLGGKRSSDGSYIELEFSAESNSIIPTISMLKETCRSLYLQEIAPSDSPVEVQPREFSCSDLTTEWLEPELDGILSSVRLLRLYRSDGFSSDFRAFLRRSRGGPNQTDGVLLFSFAAEGEYRVNVCASSSAKADHQKQQEFVADAYGYQESAVDDAGASYVCERLLHTAQISVVNCDSLGNTGSDIKQQPSEEAAPFSAAATPDEARTNLRISRYFKGVIPLPGMSKSGSDKSAGFSFGKAGEKEEGEAVIGVKTREASWGLSFWLWIRPDAGFAQWDSQKEEGGTQSHARYLNIFTRGKGDEGEGRTPSAWWDATTGRILLRASALAVTGEGVSFAEDIGAESIQSITAGQWTHVVFSFRNITATSSSSSSSPTSTAYEYSLFLNGELDVRVTFNATSILYNSLSLYFGLSGLPALIVGLRQFNLAAAAAAAAKDGVGSDSLSLDSVKELMSIEKLWLLPSFQQVSSSKRDASGSLLPQALNPFMRSSKISTLDALQPSQALLYYGLRKATDLYSLWQCRAMAHEDVVYGDDGEERTVVGSAWALDANSCATLFALTSQPKSPLEAYAARFAMREEGDNPIQSAASLSVFNLSSFDNCPVGLSEDAFDSFRKDQVEGRGGAVAEENITAHAMYHLALWLLQPGPSPCGGSSIDLLRANNPAVLQRYFDSAVSLSMKTLGFGEANAAADASMSENSQAESFFNILPFLVDPQVDESTRARARAHLHHPSFAAAKVPWHAYRNIMGALLALMWAAQRGHGASLSLWSTLVSLDSKSLLADHIALGFQHIAAVASVASDALPPLAQYYLGNSFRPSGWTESSSHRHQGAATAPASAVPSQHLFSGDIVSSALRYEREKVHSSEPVEADLLLPLYFILMDPTSSIASRTFAEDSIERHAAVAAYSSASSYNGDSTIPGIVGVVDTELASVLLLRLIESSIETSYYTVGLQPLPEMHRLSPSTADTGAISNGQLGDNDVVNQFQMDAAAGGDVGAQLDLAQAYYWGHRGVARNQARAAQYWAAAVAQSQHPDACVALGNTIVRREWDGMDESGRQRLYYPNMTSALALYECGAAANKTAALNGLGYIYFNGAEGIPIDYQRAFHYFERAAALEMDGDSLANAATCLILGKGTDRNVERALGMLHTAVQKFRHFPSAVQAGRLYWAGEKCENQTSAASSLPSDALVLHPNDTSTLLPSAAATTTICKQHRDVARALPYFYAASTFGPASNAVRSGFDRFLVQDYVGSLLSYLQAAHNGFEVGASNAAYLILRKLVATSGRSPNAVALRTMARGLALHSLQQSPSLGDKLELVPLLDMLLATDSEPGGRARWGELEFSAVPLLRIGAENGHIDSAFALARLLTSTESAADRLIAEDIYKQVMKLGLGGPLITVAAGLSWLHLYLTSGSQASSSSMMSLLSSPTQYSPVQVALLSFLGGMMASYFCCLGKRRARERGREDAVAALPDRGNAALAR